MWGFLGLLWVRCVMPFLGRIIEAVNWDSALLKTFNVLLSVFLALNIAVTVLAFERESRRASGFEATSSIDTLLDEYFSTSWMQTRFENMTINGSS
jgi:cytochrome c biogenesis protein CcdA